MIDKEAVLQMMTQSEAVYVATVRCGAPRVRALVNLRRPDRYPGACDFCRKEGFTSYFATSLASAKVSDIRADSSVAVYYSIPSQVRGIELRGHMEILTDPDIKRLLWQGEWRIYWRGGADDPDYVVLRLKPTHAAGWWGTEPFQLEVSGA
jgi:general stress protein 26